MSVLSLWCSIYSCGHSIELQMYLFFIFMYTYRSNDRGCKPNIVYCHNLPPKSWFSKCLIGDYKIFIFLPTHSVFFSLSLSQGQGLVGDGGGGSEFRGGWAAWLDTVTCERPESGESTGSRVHTQKAREGLSGGGRGGWGGEATLGTKADSTDTSHPLWVLAPWGILHSSESCSPRAEATETLSRQSRNDLWPTFNWYQTCFISAMIKYK